MILSQADEIILFVDGQHGAEPLTINEIANEIGVTWTTANRLLSIIFDIQDFLAAYELDIVGPRPKNVVFLWPRFDLGRLHKDVIDWFVKTSFFTTAKTEYTTEEALERLSFEKMKKTPFDEAVRRVVSVLKLQDQLSILEISKRALLNRRTVENVLAVILKIQDTICKYRVRLVDEYVMIEERPSIYDLDAIRLKIILANRYVPDESSIPSEKEDLVLR
jgi:hypothetical protein